MTNKFYCWRKRIAQLIFGILLFVLTYYMTCTQLKYAYSDFSLHFESASKLLSSGSIRESFQNQPYFLWHIAVNFLFQTLHFPSWRAVGCTTALIAVFTYFLCSESFLKKESAFPCLGSFLLLLVGPLYIPSFNSSIYLGQSTPNVWHNPTNMAVKPFAVLSFFLVVKILNDIRQKKPHSSISSKEYKDYFFLAVFLTLSVLAKPSFLQSFIPALGIWLVLTCIHEHFSRFFFYVCLCLTFIPAVLVLFFQFFFSFGGDGGVEFAWLEVASSSSPNPYISFLLLFAFPLIYCLFFFKDIASNTQVQLAWLNVFTATLEYFLLAETGMRKYHGNFSWAYQLSSFIVWLAVTRCFLVDLKQFREKTSVQKAKLVFVGILFLCHLAAGCLYIYQLFTVEGKWY